MTILESSAAGITARSVITSALRYRLNRLSPGETLQADAATACLDALNDIVDEIGGGKALLWREILSESSPITGATATLGVDWPALASGDLILGATVLSGGSEVHLHVVPLQRYQAALQYQVSSGRPCSIAQDGAATVYVHPAADGHVITLRTREAITEFADLDTEHSMPAGYRSALSDMLAERLAPTLAPEMLATASVAARRARSRLAAQAMVPAIIDATPAPRAGNILGGY